MPSQDDREIVSSLRSLSHIDPPAESVRRMERFLDRRLRRPRRTRIAAIALAAMLLIGIGITLVMTMSSPTASAAENLRRVAQINESFKGWVHLGSNDPTKRGGIYYSTIDYSHAGVSGDGTTMYFDKTTRRELQYDPKSDTIYIGNINPAEMSESYEDASMRLALGVDIHTLMDHWKAEGPQADFKVKQSTDGKYERYDIEFAPTNKQTYWFDSKTKLLAKVEANIGGKDWTNYYRYNDPVVHDIYDVGVPRNAKVVDNRPAGELKEVLDQIDRKIERGIGDSVAILMKQIFKDDESPGGIGQLELYGQSGQKWAWYRFNVGSWKLSEITAMASFGPPIDAPAGWPAITGVESVLSDLPKHIASESFVWDGHKSRRIEEWTVDETRLAPQVLDENWESGSRQAFGFPGRFIFGSAALMFYQPTTAGRIVRDDAHRGLIGIDVSADYKHYKLWIDPGRDDVPIEYTAMRMGRKDRVDSVETIHFLAWQQMTDHHWYPSQWQQKTIRDYLTLKDTLHENCFLLIDPNARLDAQWFTNPMKRFGPATMPAEPARPTTSATQRSDASAPAG